MKNIIIYVLVFVLESCSSSHHELKLINRTNHTVRYIREIMNETDTIPSLLYCEKRNLYNILDNYEEYIWVHEPWETTLKIDPSKTLRVFIINEDTLKKYGVCEIIKQQYFMKRYDSKYDDLVKADWNIVYDGK